MAYSSTLELVQLSEHELGHDTAGASSQRADILSHMNNGQKIILSGGGILNVDNNGRMQDEPVIFKFSLSATPKIVTLRPAITNITASVNRNDTSITFSAAPDGANSIAGWFIRINEEPELYQISAHTAAATTATLDGSYVGPVNASASACKIIKLQYSVGSSDVLRLTDPIVSFNCPDDTISIVDRDTMLRDYPLSLVGEAFPQYAMIVKESDGTFTLQFSSYPHDIARIEIPWVPIPATMDVANVNSVLPVQDREILAHYATYMLMPRNGDNRTAVQLKLAQDGFAALKLRDENNSSIADINYSRIKIRGFASNRRYDVRKPYN